MCGMACRLHSLYGVMPDMLGMRLRAGTAEKLTMKERYGVIMRVRSIVAIGMVRDHANRTPCGSKTLTHEEYVIMNTITHRLARLRFLDGVLSRIEDRMEHEFFQGNDTTWYQLLRMQQEKMTERELIKKMV